MIKAKPNSRVRTGYPKKPLTLDPGSYTDYRDDRERPKKPLHGLGSRLKMMRAIAASVVFGAALTITVIAISDSAQAQYPRRVQQAQPGGLLGAIIQAGARSHAKQSWEALAPPMQACMDRALSMKGTSVERLSAEGIGTNDSRIAVFLNRCEALTGRELRLDFECTIVQAGVSIPTRCNEEYAESLGAQMRVISRDQYILDGLRGERVNVTQLETHDAMQARVQSDVAKQAEAEAAQARAEAEREKEAAAAAVAAQKVAETNRKKQDAADAALRQSFAQRDAAIQLSRRACSVKEAGAMSKMFGGGSDHDVLAGLLNTSTPPLRAYQQFVAWIPKSSDRQGLLIALQDRIDYDSKRWGSVISHSGGGDYSWDTLKGSLATLAEGCLWQQYDQLGVAAAQAISPSSVTIASGQAKAVSDPDRVSATILSRIPSTKFFHR